MEGVKVKRYVLNYRHPRSEDWCRSTVEIRTGPGSWVEIRHVRNQAPHCAVLAELMLRLGLVKARRVWEGVPEQEAQYVVDTPDELLGRKVGYTCRKGSTGAFWGHCWEVDCHGWRKRCLASWHESMEGKMNEPVYGYAEILFSVYAMGCEDAGRYIGSITALQLKEERRFEDSETELLGAEIYSVHARLPGNQEWEIPDFESGAGRDEAGEEERESSSGACI